LAARNASVTTEHQIRAIELRLSAPFPNHSRIAAEVGVSVDTVARIAKHGRRYRRLPTKHARCGGCGGMQTNPCLVCASRRELTAA
jgi:hypothetical protein